MKILSQIFFFIILLTLFLTIKSDDIKKDGEVYILTDKNFEDFINKHENVFVKFYAPWCGHCKELEPEFKKAAVTLAQEQIFFAQVDTTTEKGLADKYNVLGIPDLRFFSNKDYIIYNGIRIEETMIEWIRKKIVWTVHQVSIIEDFEKILQDNNVIVSYFGKQNTKEYDTFYQVSKKFDDIVFIQTEQQEILQSKNVETTPSIVLFKNFDEKRNDYTGDLLNELAIQDFINENMFPLIMKLDEKSGDRIFGQKQVCLILLRNESEASDKAYIEFEKAADSLRGKILFAYSDIVSEFGQRFAEYVGINNSSLPKVLIIEASEDLLKFLMNEEITESKIKEFFGLYILGELRPEFKSQEIPESNDNIVKEVVGKNFEEVVLDEKMNVLVFFYAPWCGHCQAFIPIYEKLAEKLQSNKNLLFTRVDATENEIPGQNIEGFPTIRFFKAQDKEPIEFEGERDEESLILFIKDKMLSNIQIDKITKDEKSINLENEKHDDL